MNTHDLLILSDIEFLSNVSQYFTAIFQPPSTAKPAAVKDEKENERDLEETLTAPGIKQPQETETAEAPKGGVHKKEKEKVSLPRLKCQVSISNFRVAIVEDVFSENPQALSLTVSVWMRRETIS